MCYPSLYMVGSLSAAFCSFPHQHYLAEHHTHGRDSIHLYGKNESTFRRECMNNLSGWCQTKLKIEILTLKPFSKEDDVG